MREELKDDIVYVFFRTALASHNPRLAPEKDKHLGARALKNVSSKRNSDYSG